MNALLLLKSIHTIFNSELDRLEKRKAEIEADAKHSKNLLFKYHWLHSQQQERDLKIIAKQIENQITNLNKIKAEVVEAIRQFKKTTLLSSLVIAMRVLSQ